MLKRIKVKLAAFTEPPSTLGRLSAERQFGSGPLCPRHCRLPDSRARQGIADRRRPDQGLSERSVFFRAQGPDAVRERAYRRCDAPYEEAIRLAPKAALLRIALAQAYIENNDPAKNRRAIAYLNDAVRTEDKDPKPGICSRPPMAGTTRSAWRRWRWQRRGSPPTTRRSGSGGQAGGTPVAEERHRPCAGSRDPAASQRPRRFGLSARRLLSWIPAVFS